MRGRSDGCRLREGVHLPYVNSPNAGNCGGPSSRRARLLVFGEVDVFARKSRPHFIHPFDFLLFESNVNHELTLSQHVTVHVAMSRNAHQSRGRSSPPSDEGRINDEERPSKRHKETHPQELSRFKEVGLMRNGMGRASASFIGSASGIHFIRSVYSAMAGRTSHPHGEDPESNLVPGEDDRLDSGWGNSRYLQIWQPHEVNLANDPLKETFTFDDLVHWSGSYFDLWHPAYPFLHAPSILESFERFAQNGLPRENTYDSILIRAIISISLCDRRQRNDPFPRPVPKCLVFTTFEDALESIQPAVTNAATISALQAVVSVQLLEVSMLRLKSASRLGGLVIRLAFQMGLHRCPSRFVAFSLAERQLRQRLFWSIYCIDRHLCQALGLPLTVRDDDIDVCYPDQERHILPAANPQQHAGARKREQQADSRLMILALLARHAEIKGCIMELRNKMVSSREESLERAVFVNSRLTQWWNQVEDAIEQAEYQGAPFNVLHKAIFTVLKHESKIALNRPLLTTSKKTASYAGALHSCIAASKAIISTLHALVAPVNDTISLSPGQNQKVYQPMFWPSFTWAVWMSAFIMLYAAMENEVDSHIAMR